MEASNIYTYHATWSEENEAYVATCKEFPSLSYLDSSKDIALQGIIDLVESIIEDMKTQDELIPQPTAQKQL